MDDDIREADLSDLLDEFGVRELSTAIRRRDFHAAEVALDRIDSDDFRVREWVEQSRYAATRKEPLPQLSEPSPVTHFDPSYWTPRQRAIADAKSRRSAA